MLEIIFVQSFSFIGWLFLLLSYWHKDINKLLVFQLISGLFYMVHYFLLGATEGLFIIAFELIRDFSYYKTDADKYIFLGTIPIYIIGGFFAYHGIVSLFPTIASIIDGYSLSYNSKIAVIGGLISESLWLVYNFISGSYVGVFTSIIMITSNFIVLVKRSLERVKVKLLNVPSNI